MSAILIVAAYMIGILHGAIQSYYGRKSIVYLTFGVSISIALLMYLNNS